MYLKQSWAWLQRIQFRRGKRSNRGVVDHKVDITEQVTQTDISGILIVRYIFGAFQCGKPFLICLRRRSLVADINLTPKYPDGGPCATVGKEGADFAEGPEFGFRVLLADFHAVGFLRQRVY